MNKVEARDLYERICDLVYDAPTAVLGLRLSSVSAEVDLILKDLVVTPEDQRVISAPTAWHAAITLIFIMSELASKTPLDEQFSHIKSKEDLNFVPAMNVLFRGQSDVSRAPIPTLYREGVDKDHSYRAQAAFCLYLRHAFEKLTNFSFQAWIYQSAAQHYELKTSLLDWTTDPTVATYFAATGTVRSTSQKAGVFVMLLPNAVGNGAKFFLPPPFIERLYLQRGVFTHAPDDKQELFENKIFLQIRFPAEPDFYVRRDKSEIDIYPANEWLMNVKLWAERLATEGVNLELSSEPTQSEIGRLEQVLDAALVEIPIPDAIKDNPKLHVELWLDHILSMIGYLSQLETNNGLKMNLQSFTAIVHDNSRIMRPLAKYLEEQGALQQKENSGPNYFVQLSKQIQAALKSSPDV